MRLWRNFVHNQAEVKLPSHNYSFVDGELASEFAFLDRNPVQRETTF